MLTVKELTPDKCCTITGSNKRVVDVKLNDNIKFNGTVSWDELWNLLQRNEAAGKGNDKPKSTPTKKEAVTKES